VLIVVISRKTFEYNNKPAPTHSFDGGAAWENFALQGSLMGLVVHGMQGFNYEKARQVLNVPADYQVEAMIAVGKPGRKGGSAGGIAGQGETLYPQAGDRDRLRGIIPRLN
jgi:nitroreductase